MIRCAAFGLLAAAMLWLGALAAPLRADPPAGDPVPVTYRAYEWEHGQPPVRMIRADEGICFLTAVRGHFAGGGEEVRVYIGDDGYWYLGGNAGQNIWAKAMSVQFSRKFVVHLRKAPADDESRIWEEKLQSSNEHRLADFAGQRKTFAQGDGPLATVAQREANATGNRRLVEIAVAWNDAAQTLPPSQRTVVDGHVLDLIDSALSLGSDEEQKSLTALAQSAWLQCLNRELNDLNSYQREGTWTASADGIVGSGESTATFLHLLPSDGVLEFKMTVLDGMRPRIRFPGAALFLGNEGYDRQIEMHNAKAYRGVPAPYLLGQTLSVRLVLQGESAELWVDGELMSHGKRRFTPATMGLLLRGGDNWSHGTTRFTDIHLSPLPAAHPATAPAATQPSANEAKP